MRSVTHPRSGYTLFEMVLILAVLVVLAAIVYPSLDGMFGDYRITAAADQVRAAWAEAQAHAMDEGRPYRFAVIPGKGNYRIAPDSGEFWAGGNSPSDNSGTPPFVLESALPKGVRFAAGEGPDSRAIDLGGDSAAPAGSLDPSAYSTMTVFLPDGSASDDVRVAFSAKGGKPVVLKLRGLTGVVTMSSQ